METGLTELDKLVDIDRGDIIVIASRPSFGKSCLLRQIASRFLKQGLNIGIVDLERTKETSLFQLVCMNKDIKNIFNKSSGGITDYIDFSKNYLSLEETWIQVEVGNEFKSLIEMEKWPDVLFIDSIQMLSTSLESWFEIAQMLKKIKIRAITERVVVFLTGDISRNVEKRNGNRPILSDLSDSSSLEEIADKVILLHKRCYYDPNNKPGMVEFIIAKNRNNEVGTCNFHFHEKFGKFINLPPREYISFNDECFKDFSPDNIKK